jgi:hypothetical protein
MRCCDEGARLTGPRTGRAPFDRPAAEAFAKEQPRKGANGRKQA